MQHRETLGLHNGPITSEDIKKAWRDLCKKYHPDNLAQFGPEFGAIAEEKMKSINAAKDYLSAMYG